MYPVQPFFIFTPVGSSSTARLMPISNTLTTLLSQWGWPAADGTVSYYYQGQYPRIVSER